MIMPGSSLSAAAPLLVLLALVCCLVIGQGPPPASTGKVVKEDLEYIKCEACERGVLELYNVVQRARSKAPNKNLPEVHIVELIEAIGQPKNVSGEWIRRIDIVESLDKGKKFLVFEDQADMGKCVNECSTIAQSVQDLFQEDIDADDLSAILWKDTIELEDLQDKVCKQWSSRCAKPRRKPLANKYKRADEEFAAQGEKELEMERMMANMAEMGMKSDMYSREDMMAQMAGMDGYGDEDGYGGMDDIGGMGGMDPYGDEEQDDYEV
ncbi:hypothetical protein B484DRAFT_137288 [Ochromonadaceae sp. CCMP2298]|nr:hypothetical protein B484DRAFT_137288 [Ochromonadaceae sp. CCMP2298]